MTNTTQSNDRIGEILETLKFGIDDIFDCPGGHRFDTFEYNQARQAIENIVNEEVTKVLNRLKEYNGAYIGMDGKRVDNMVNHSVIDEELKNYE